MNNPSNEFRESFAEMDGKLIAWGSLVLFLVDRYARSREDVGALIDVIETMDISIFGHATDVNESYLRGYNSVIRDVVRHLENLR